MDITAIMQAISTLGFPIVMCLVLIYYINKNDKRYDEQIFNILTSLNNNTVAFTKLSEKLDSAFEKKDAS